MSTCRKAAVRSAVHTPISTESFNNPYGASRFDEDGGAFQSSYETPGWQRAHRRSGDEQGGSQSRRQGPMQIEGELVATSSADSAAYDVGARVFHQKFGYGDVTAVDGNKLTVEFDKAGRKRVVDSFLQPA